MWITDDVTPRLVRTTGPGALTTVPIPSGSPATGITAGPDGAIWFTQAQTGTVARIEGDGGITELVLTVPDGGALAPVEIATGADGNLWISLFPDGVARVSPAGVATRFDVSIADAGSLEPSVLAAGPDGNVWFASAALPVISRITPAGVVTHYPVSTRSFGVAAGPEGAVWFTMVKKLGRVTFGPDPTITEFDTPDMQPAEIAVGPDCASVYVADALGNRVRRFTPPAGDAGADAGIAFTDFAAPTANADVESLAIGAEDAVWFVEIATARLGLVRP
jgi:virginiamycin B lyase